ncbi:MAG: hypothetical protein ACK5XS_04900 [Armatimonadota bacterium]|jgi:hypothetical protein|nr:hypothetical protein [Fimbriimonadaceae bacterium]
MSNTGLELTRFEKRVRRLRATQGAAMGASIGGLAVVAWALADRFGSAYVTWPAATAVVGGLTLAGAAAGWFWRVSPLDLARSIDRRAGLKNRLGTAMSTPESAWADAQRADAERKLEGLDPQTVFPWSGNRVLTGALCALILAGGAYAWARSDFGMSAAEKQERAELASRAEEVRRVAKEGLENTPRELSAMEKDLRTDIESFAKELERGKLDREQALVKANELAKQAETAAQDRFSAAGRDLDEAGETLREAQGRAIEAAGLKKEQVEDLNLDSNQKELLGRLMEAEKFENPPSRFNEQTKQAAGMQNADDRLLNMSDSQRQQLQQRLQQQMNQLQQQMQSGGMTPEQRQQIEQRQQQLQMTPEQRQALEQAMQNPAAAQDPAVREQLEQMAQQPDVSPAMKEALEALMNNQALQDAAQEMMREALEQGNLNPQVMEQLAEQLQQQGAPTPEQQQQMQKQLEQMQQLMQGLQNSQAAQQALQQMMNNPEIQEAMRAMSELRQAQQQMQQGGQMSQEQQQQLQQSIEQAIEGLDPQTQAQLQRQMQGALQQMMAGQANRETIQQLMDAVGMPQQNANGPGGQRDPNGKLNLRDTPVEPGGQGVRTGVTGERRELDGTEQSIEVRAPAKLGQGPSVPYEQVLPQYRQNADKAVSGNKVPKQHRERVKKYFDSLQKKP